MAVIVAQLAERSVLIAEVRGLNPDTDKFLKNIYLLSTLLYRKDEKREKEAGNNSLKKETKTAISKL